MATAQDLAELIDSKPFRDRVNYYLTKAAIAVSNENYGGTGQPTAAEHTLRMAFGEKILMGSVNIREFCRGVITNSTIMQKFLAGENVYGDLEFVVNSIYDAFAGIDNGVDNSGV
jgi:hypothetical protein